MIQASFCQYLEKVQLYKTLRIDSVQNLLHDLYCVAYTKNNFVWINFKHESLIIVSDSILAHRYSLELILHLLITII